MNGLTPDERALLQRPEIRALAPAEQLAWLRRNRKVGLFVTGFAGGVRVLLLFGGAAAATGLGIAGLTQPDARDGSAWLLLTFGVALWPLAIWLGTKLVRRVSELRRPIDDDAVDTITR